MFKDKKALSQHEFLCLSRMPAFVDIKPKFVTAVIMYVRCEIREGSNEIIK
jgi:hypothetical protein